MLQRFYSHDLHDELNLIKVYKWLLLVSLPPGGQTAKLQHIIKSHCIQYKYWWSQLFEHL